MIEKFAHKLVEEHHSARMVDKYHNSARHTSKNNQKSHSPYLLGNLKGKNARVYGHQEALTISLMNIIKNEAAGAKRLAIILA